MNTLTITAVFLITICSEANAQSHSIHTGDTVWPGSQAWIRAGSPHNTVTGDSTILVCGSDGELHPIGVAVQIAGRNLIINTPKDNGLVRLEEAVREIMQESPDRIIPKPRKAHTPVSRVPDRGYNPYAYVMHWADSIAKVYQDPEFLEEMQEFYRLPKTVGVTPWDTPMTNTDEDV